MKRLWFVVMVALLGAPALSRAQDAGVSPQPHALVIVVPIVGGNVANAKRRALDDAFRQAVEAVFTTLLAEIGVAPPMALPPALVQLRASFFGKPQRYIRSYRILGEQEQGGHLRVEITADVHEGLLRREIDRAKAAGAPKASGLSAIVAGPNADANLAVAKAFTAAGVRADAPPLSTTDEAILRDIALKSGATAAVVVAANVNAEGLVRGTTNLAAICEIRLKAVAVRVPAVREESAQSRGFAPSEDAARLNCLANAATDATRPMARSMAAAIPTAGDGYVVSLLLDVTEPATLPVVMQVLRRLGGVSSSEVRRVTPGAAEIRVITRLGGTTLANALARELSSRLSARVLQAAADRVVMEVRLRPAIDPATAPMSPQ